MAYLRIADFRAGMDTRRPAFAGEPGTIYELINGHLTRGADVERRRDFVPTYNLAEGQTFGLLEIAGALYVFGSAADVAVPPGVVYQQLSPSVSSTASMVKVWDAEIFNGRPYVVAEYDDGSIWHFYDGVRVSEWDTISASDATFATTAEFLAERISRNMRYEASAVGPVITIKSRHWGVPYTVATSVTNHTGGVDDQTATVAELQPNVPMQDEVLATGGFRIAAGAVGPDNVIAAVEVNGLDVLAHPVPWQTDNDFSASLVAQAVNLASAATGYTASSLGDMVTIVAPNGTGASANGEAVFVAATGEVVVADIANLAGGSDFIPPQSQIVTVTLGGTFEWRDLFAITLDGETFRARGHAGVTGTAIKTFKSKMYAIAGRMLRFSEVNNCLGWTDIADGAGFIAFANQASVAERFTALDTYQGYLCVFSRRAIVVEQIDPDPALNRLVTILENTGTISPRSVVNYGNADVFYLADDGIRSLKPRISTDAAFVSDVGSAIDSTVNEDRSLVDGYDIENAVGIMEPENGRYLLAVGNRIYVFSFFPAAKIQAWSIYEPGFRVDWFARIGRVLYARSGDVIYAYGGTEGDQFPPDGDVELYMRLPYLTAGRDSSQKDLEGIDLAAINRWSMRVLIDPNDLDIATGEVSVTDVTHPYGRIAIEATSTHFAPELRCSAGGEAKLSSMTLHFQQGEES